jgi:hypothetical protein
MPEMLAAAAAAATSAGATLATATGGPRRLRIELRIVESLATRTTTTLEQPQSCQAKGQKCTLHDGASSSGLFRIFDKITQNCYRPTGAENSNKSSQSVRSAQTAVFEQ